MARSIDTILAEINTKTDPQRQTILRQVADIPTQMKAEEASLGAKKTEAFDEILGGARRRGLGFSGIPVGEQARFAATEYAPALARMKTSFNDRRSTLESALADIDRTNYFQAQDLFARDREFAENQRRFELQQQEARRASAAANARPSWMDFLAPPPAAPAARDPEEAAYQAYLKQQAAVNRAAPKTNKGLRVVSGANPGLSIRGGGSIPTPTQFTGNIRLPGF